MIYKLEVNIKVMERSCLEVLQVLAEARRNFFRRMPYFPNPDVTLNFINAENEYMRLLNRLLTPRPITITFPIEIPAGFMDPVPVLPTAEQINAEIVDLEGISQAACAICQEGIAADGCQLQTCRHYYHRTCIRTWFGASSLCPVCRRDIRGDQEDQSSSVSSETSLQEMSQ